MKRRYANIDATLDEYEPHFHGELNIRVLQDEVPMTLSGTPMPADWWTFKNIIIEIDGDAYRMGKASGLGCNSLIDALRQTLDVCCDTDFIRCGFTLNAKPRRR